MNGNIGGRVGRLLGRDAKLQKARFCVIRLVCRVLQVQPLVGKMPQVFILGIIRFTVDLQRHMVRLCIFDLLFAALDVPFAPRSDDSQVRCKGFYGKLKAYLVVALARASVADSVRAFLFGDLYQLLRNGRARKAGSQQVGAFVFCPRLHRGNDIVFHKLVHKVHHIQLAGAGGKRLGLQSVQLCSLPYVSGGGNDLAAVILFQPGNDDGGIQPAGIGEHHFFVLLFLLFHVRSLLLQISSAGTPAFVPGLFPGKYRCRVTAPWRGSFSGADSAGMQTARAAHSAPSHIRHP